MGECKIEQDMSMTEYEKIDFIRFPKFFGKAYQVLVFLALIFGVVISGLSTMGRPSQCKSNGPLPVAERFDTGGVWPRKDIGRSGFEIFF